VAATPIVKQTEVVVGEIAVLRSGPVLQRMFIPLEVVERTEVVNKEVEGYGSAAAPAAVRGADGEPHTPQNGAADSPASAGGAVSAQYVSRNVGGDTAISPHLAQAREAVERPRGADVARAVVQGVMAGTTAAVAAASRAAGDVLSGGPTRDATVVGTVEGVGGAAATVARAAMIGTAQGMFWSAVDAAGDEAEPAQYLVAVTSLTAAEAAAQQGAAMVARVAQAATAVERVLPAAVEAAVGQLVPTRFFHIPRVDALASFNDAMLAFIDDSALMPKPLNHSRARAWAVTAVVIAADIALLVYWHKSRANQQGRRRPRMAHPIIA